MKKSRKKESFIRQPKYLGGKEALQAFLNSKIQYPKEALQENISGIVKVKIDINQKGTVKKAHLISGIGYGCDEEALRVSQLLQFDVPKHRGIKIVFHKTIRIQFKPPTKKVHPAQTAVQYSTTQTSVKKSAVKKPPVSYGYTISIRKK